MTRRAFLKRVGIVCAVIVPVLCGGSVNAADPQPVTALVTYHSATGNTEKITQGVAEGAKAVSGTSVVLKRVGDVTDNDLLSSDAVMLGSPVYFGNMAGEVSVGGGFGATATTGPDSLGIDEKALTEARDLGKRIAEVAAVVKRGSGKERCCEPHRGSLRRAGSTLNRGHLT